MKNQHSLPPLLVGISGQIGHGKNLLGTALCLYDPSFRTLAVADPLRHVASKVFYLNPDMFATQQAKASPFTTPIRMDEHLENLQEVTGLALRPARKTARTPRELLQFLGTDYVRKAAPNYWVDLLVSRVSAEGRNTVVTDVRFDNEAKALKRAGGVIVQIVRDREVAPAQHVSEAVDLEPDMVFHVQSGRIDQIHASAKAAHTYVSALATSLNIHEAMGVNVNRIEMAAKRRAEQDRSNLKSCDQGLPVEVKSLLKR